MKTDLSPQVPEESRTPAQGPADLLQAFLTAGQNFRRFVDRLSEALERARPSIVSFFEAVEKLPAALQAALVRLADEGWYLDFRGMSLRQPADLAAAYLAGRHKEVEDALVEHYRLRLGEIEEDLAEDFPARAHIFRQAFSTHRQGLYYVSVPTLLAQADGLCLDFLGEHFFRGDWSQNGAALQKLAHLDVISKALLAPFFSKTSIRLSESKRSEGFDKLNRHLVLHGESLDYGTEVRSLQAVAFLYYVAVALKGQLSRSPPLAATGPGSSSPAAASDQSEPGQAG